MAPASLSLWERGSRPVPQSAVVAIDNALRCGGALTDLSFALTTPQVSDGRAVWMHNFPAESGPVWTWIRTPNVTATTAEISWGPWRAAIEVPTGDGVVVTAPFSIPNPAAVVDVVGGGWVDFGRSDPTGLAPAPIVAGLELVRPTEDRNNTLRLLSDHFRTLLDRAGRSSVELARFLGIDIDVVDSVVGVRHSASAIPTLSAADADGSSPGVIGARFLRARTARALSWNDVVALCAKLPGADQLGKVTLAAVRSFESGGMPRVRELVARLDTCLRLDGHLGVVELGTGNGAQEIRFPEYWVGPVWIGVAGATDVDVELRWGDYRRLFRAASPVRVTCRKSVPGRDPLLVRAPAGSSVSWGVGHDSGAVDVNADWLPVETSSQVRLIDTALELLLAITGRTSADLEAFACGAASG